MTLRARWFAVFVGVSFAPLAVMAQSTAPKNDYRQAETWLCRPGRQDACAVDLSTTVVAANGQMSREAFTPAANPPIDCFYVYPTVSLDPDGNSDMVAGPVERNVARAQCGRSPAVRPARTHQAHRVG